MVSLEEKQKVINQGYDKLERQLSNQIFRLTKEWNPNSGPMSDNLKQAIEKYDSFSSCPILGDYFRLAGKINHNHYKRTARLRERIGSAVLNGSAVFLTLTFSDYTLNNTKPDTRRQYVVKFLKSQGNLYIANLDYGSTNGREHYHAIVRAHSIDFSKWKYGAVNGRKVKTTENDLKRTAKYVSKLTNHAIKQTATQARIIYSR